MQPTVPMAIAALLPLIATMLSSLLADDKLAPSTNAAIALTAILLTATLCEFLSADIPVSWTLRLIGVLLYVGVLMQGDLSVLYQYLVAKPSPIAPAPLAQAVRAPVALTLPDKAIPTLPRASAQPQPPTS